MNCSYIVQTPAFAFHGSSFSAPRDQLRAALAVLKK